MRHKRLLQYTIGGLILATLFLESCGATKLPTLRMAAACTVVEGKVYIIGGITKKGEITSVVEEYNPSADQWVSRASMPTPRSMASAVTINKKIYVLGGRNESGITDSVEVYDPSRDSWEKVTVMPQARWNHMVAELQGKIYVIGGIVGTGDSRRSIDKVQIYDPTTNSWKSGHSLTTPRQGSAIAVSQEKIYVIGGRIGAGRSGTATNTVEVYDLSSELWNLVEPAQDRRTGARAVVVENRIYVIGGAVEGEETGSIEMYDPASDTWVMMDLSLQEPRTGHCAISLDKKIYVCCGANEQSLAGIVGTVEELTVK